MPKKKKKGSKKDKSEKCQKEKIDLTNENKEDDILKSKSNFLLTLGVFILNYLVSNIVKNQK